MGLVAISLLGGTLFFPFSRLAWPRHWLPRHHSKQQWYDSHHTHTSPTQPPRPDSCLHRVCH